MAAHPAICPQVGFKPFEVEHEEITPSCLDVTVNSLAFKILACIPIVGTFSTLFSLVYLYNKFDPDLSLEEKLQIKKTERDYYCASTVRNVADFALVSLGILSATLSNPISSVIFTAWWAYDWIQADLTIQKVEK